MHKVMQWPPTEGTFRRTLAVVNSTDFSKLETCTLIPRLLRWRCKFLVEPRALITTRATSVPMFHTKAISTVSARNVFRYLYSIFMFAASLVIFVFAPLVLLFGSLVFHCPRSFVLCVRIFLHIVYLAFIVIFRVSSSLVALGSVYSLMLGFLLVLVFRPFLAIVL